MTLCSVIIGTHQRLRYLKESLASALGQTGVDVEVIVVENGSTDGTAEYLRSLADRRVVPVIHEQALGGTRARSLGMAAAKGDWIGFLDDDDLWAPDKLQSEIAAAQDADRSWAYTGCVFIDAECEVIGGQPPLTPEDAASLLPVRYSIPGGTSSLIWRAGALEQGELLEARLTYMVDWDISLRLLSKGLPAAVERPLVGYRQHGANMSIRAGTYLTELAVIEEKFQHLRQGRRLDIASQYRNAGSEFARAGYKRQAFKHYVEAGRRGDRGAMLRAAALLVPRKAWPWLRLRFLSNEKWMEMSEEWLAEHRRGHPAVRLVPVGAEA